MPKNSTPPTPRNKAQAERPLYKSSSPKPGAPHRGVSTDHDSLHDTQLALSTVATEAPNEAQPFLKWVGGKGQLLDQLDEFFPTEITRYFEPFVGGGAVFFHLKHRFPKMRAVLSDINGELINTYKAVQQQPQELMRRLDEHAAEFKAKGNDYFYYVRSDHDVVGNEKKIIERAARMIFLNKTCFNGLWRVNSSGKFNVPVGSYKNPKLYDEENIWAANRALQDTQLEVQNFRRTFDQTERGDFIYADPPYYPVSRTANFTSYAKEEFGEDEQRELHAVFGEAARRGVRVMLSNSDTPFIRDLYGDFQIHTVQARRAINCDGSKRGEINEAIVMSDGNFPKTN